VVWQGGKLKKWQVTDEKALWGGEKCLRKAGSLSYLVLVDSVFPSRFFKGAFLAAVVLEPLWAESGIFEDQGAAIAKWDLGWSPSGALVILPRIIPYRLPFLIEPSEIRFVMTVEGRLPFKYTLILPIQSILIIFPSILQSSVVGVIATAYTTTRSYGEDIFKGATLST
jgi:hypothetical protein